VAASQPDWLGLQLATSSRRQLIDVRYGFGAELPPISDERSFGEVVVTGQPAISDLSPATLPDRIDVAVRVRIWRNGAVAYVLSAIVAPSSIYRIRQAQQIPSDWVGWSLTAIDALLPARLPTRSDSESCRRQTCRPRYPRRRGGGLNFRVSITASSLGRCTSVLKFPD